MNKILMSGNHTAAEAAIRAGCRAYFGYPITPQNELGEYMAEHMREFGGIFVQSESELAAINMVVGAAATGVRAMTSSSSPGISLKQEGLSFLAGFELPAVIVNVMRGGPGMGNIAPAQGDYFQATRGGGHGDYRTPVLAPGSIQEIADMIFLAFDIADRYRTPVMLLADGMMGQIKEPVIFPDFIDPQNLPKKEWALTGRGKKKSRYLASLVLDSEKMEKHNWSLFKKYEVIAANETRYESYHAEEADVIVVAYGTTARIAKGAINQLREEEGLSVGLIRPITLWPFPSEILHTLAKRAKKFIALEMSTGQMVEDVRLALNGKAQTLFYGRPGGIIPEPDEFAHVIRDAVKS